MESNVRLDYLKFPEIIQSGFVKISDEQSIKLSVSDGAPNSIVIEIRDNSFGTEYLNSFILEYDTAKDFYNILVQLLKQVKDNVKVV